MVPVGGNTSVGVLGRGGRLRWEIGNLTIRYISVSSSTRNTRLEALPRRRIRCWSLWRPPICRNSNFTLKWTIFIPGASGTNRDDRSNSGGDGEHRRHDRGGGAGHAAGAGRGGLAERVEECSCSPRTVSQRMKAHGIDPRSPGKQHPSEEVQPTSGTSPPRWEPRRPSANTRSWEPTPETR